MVSQKEMKKKIIKKTKEEFRLGFAKDQLEHKKNVYETYLKVLIKYNLSSTAYSSIKSDEMYHNELLRLWDRTRNDHKSFARLMFGDPTEKKLTELESIKKSEEYYDKLINLIENRISMFTDEVKMKMAKDSIEKQQAYFGLNDIERKNEKITKNTKSS